VRAPKMAFRVSVLDTAATTAMVRELEEVWGGIDVLINNASVGQNLSLTLRKRYRGLPLVAIQSK